MTKLKRTKILAGFLAFMMIVSMLPTTIFAAEIKNYSVQLTDGAEVLDLEDVEITMTNKADESKTATVETKDGVAKFENFVEEEATYIISVSDVIGYETIDDIEVVVAVGDESTDVVMTEIAKVKVSGTVTDESGKPYSGAKVKVSGYVTVETTTNRNGHYTFETYAGKENTISITAKDKDQKYGVISNAVTYNTDATNANYQFAVQTFDILTEAGEHGIIDASKSDVLYGEDYIINIKADEGYSIEKVYVNGEEKLDVDGKKTFQVEINSIDKDYKITASFRRMTYKITFKVHENGHVTYEDNGTQTIPSGEISVEKIFEESTDSEQPTIVSITATPTVNYRVSKVTIDGKEKNFSENDYEYKTDLIMTDDHTFEVEFASNQFSLVVECGENGKANWGDSDSNSETVVNYGEPARLNIFPEEGYRISSVKINDTESTYEEDENGAFIEITEIDSDKTVVIVFEESPEVTVDNQLSNEFYKITYPALVKEVYQENGTCVVVLPNEPNLSVTIEPVSPYAEIKINSPYAYGKYKRSISIFETTTITNAYVRVDYKDTAVNCTVNVKIIIDKDAPTHDSIQAPDWVNKNTVTVTGTVEDKGGSGLNYVVWSKEEELTREEVLAETERKVAITNGEYSFESEAGEQCSDYYVYAVDYAGNVSDSKTVTVKIDTTPAVVENFEISQSGNEVFNHFTFGMFSNKKIQITVTAADNNNVDEVEMSGVKSITLYLKGEEYTKEYTQEVDDDNKAVFDIVLENTNECLTADISAVATDKVGNTAIESVVLTHENSNVEEGASWMLENILPTKPVISPKTPVITLESTSAEEDRVWCATDVEFDVSAKDEHSGIREVVIKINDEKVLNSILVGEDGKDIHTLNKTYSVNTEDGIANKDGSYTVSATVTDNAGNVSKTAEYTIYKDTTSPSIAGFDFGKNEYVENSAENVIETDYGYYFEQATAVTITAQDGQDGAPTSGVKQIAVYLEDVVEKKLYIIDSEGMLKEIATEEEAVNYLVNEKDQIQITIPANFKGQIYAKATDNVMNVGEFVNPNGVIVESEEKHNNAKYEHIMFEKVETNYKTNNGTALYKKDVDVIITVTDTYSGIRKIEWSVVAPYDEENNQNGETVIANGDKDIDESGWEVVSREQNLITAAKKRITVNNNSNDIVVHVKMTDRAGNVTEDKIELSIDKSKPNIAIVYDEKEVHDSTNTDFFSTDRTATITITERNFRASDVEFAITNTDKVIPNVDLTDDKTWTKTVDESNPDNTTYVAKIPYTADGDYTFDISYKDNAENPANTVAQHKFTIDKTVPTVAVSYDNMSAMNGNYYKAARTATITIKEHNFDASRVNVIGVATDNGAASRFPVTSAWRDNGNDTHTATIAYTADSKYTFDIEFHDMANNSIADYTPEEFYVDKTAPNLSITGVADQSANNGDVAPVITFTDTNFNKDAVTITLSGVNNGRDLKYAGSYNNIANGQTYTYANFEKVQSVDDIYTLTARLTDKAGNQTEKTITFSANRFGSVYSLENVEDIIGKYLKNEQDIVFTETNVDSLDREGIKVKLTKNGMPTDLVEGKDYTIEASGGNGQWSVYKYTVKKALFADDGRYSISIYSKDAAGNVNENIDETKTAEISFGIDKTNPVIVPINLKSDVQYAVDMKTVSVEIKDNLVLEDVKIYLNGKEIEYTVEGETYTFDIPKDSSKQDVKIVAIDAAGNEEPVEITDFLVNANIFVRWYNNTALFVGSIIGVVVIALGITGFIVFGKKKKEE